MPYGELRVPDAMILDGDKDYEQFYTFTVSDFQYYLLLVYGIVFTQIVFRSTTTAERTSPSRFL